MDLGEERHSTAPGSRCRKLEGGKCPLCARLFQTWPPLLVTHPLRCYDYLQLTGEETEARGFDWPMITEQVSGRVQSDISV